MGRDVNCEICGLVFFGETSASFCPSCKPEHDRLMQRKRDARYKDKVRHDGKRRKIIECCGLKCAMCGKDGSHYEIVTHHIMHDKDHSQQTMLCRSCHAKEHHTGLQFGESKLQANLRVENMTIDDVRSALDGRAVEDAAEFLGISRSALFKLRKMFGLGKRRPQKVTLTKEQLLSVIHLPDKNAMETLGVSRRTLCKKRKEFGLRK